MGVMPEASTRVNELLSHAGWLRELACRLVGEAGADDAVQEVWLRASRRPPAGLESPRGWLWSALRSVHLRKVERRDAAAARERSVALTLTGDGSMGEGLPSADEMAERAEAQRLLVGAVLSLGEPERQTVLLHFFEGLTAAEISRRSAVPASTVRTRIARGVRLLRDRLDDGAGGWPGGRAAWIPAVSLLAPPSGGVITPTLLTAGAAFMWKLGISLVGLVLILWTGFQVFDVGSGGAVSPPLDVAGSTELAKGTAGGGGPLDGEAPLPVGDGERVEAGDLAAEPKEPAASVPEATGAEGIVIVGRVIDPNGRPVAGATVFEGTHSQVAMATRFAANPKRPNTQTGEEGLFRFEMESLGGAVLCARAEGFADSDEYVLEPAVLADGKEITMRLRVGATVTGVVYGRDQQPIVGREVQVSSMGLGEYRKVVTGEGGRFELARLNPGQWRSATYPSDQELLDAGEPADVASVMAQLKQAEFTLVDGETEEVILGLVSVDAPHVHGVLLHEGNPIGGLMQWYPAARPTEKMVSRANKEGHFEVDLPTPGEWITHVNATGASSRGQRRFFHLAAGERREVKIDLRGGRVGGRVVDAQGQPIKGVMLELRAVGAAPHLPKPTLGGGSATSGEDGRYEFGLLLPGAYVVVAHGSRPDAKGQKRSTARTEVVGIEGTEAVQAPPLVIVDGVSFEISVTGQGGRPVSGASLFFHDVEGHCVNPSTNTRTTSKGKATSPGFSPGPVWVTATHQSGVSSSVSVDVGTDRAVDLVIAGDHWIELDGGTDWIDETKGHVAVIDDHGRRWTGLYDFRRLFEARPSRDDPRGPMLGPFPRGSYTVEYEAPGAATRHGAVELREGSPQVSTVLLR